LDHYNGDKKEAKVS
ncbi:hypothetical protein TrRE_jg2910, partial [Triparma retinervis]